MQYMLYNNTKYIFNEYLKMLNKNMIIFENNKKIYMITSYK